MTVSTTDTAGREDRRSRAAGTQARRVMDALGVGVATVALVGSLAGPAAALDVTISPNRPQFTLAPDLRLESFTVTDMGQDYNGGGYWKLKATLRNGPVNAPSIMRTYPGGGRLVFWRTTG